MINFRVKNFSQERPLTALALIVHANFRKINFRSRHRLQKYFYNENFQIYGILINCTGPLCIQGTSFQNLYPLHLLSIMTNTVWFHSGLWYRKFILIVYYFTVERCARPVCRLLWDTGQEKVWASLAQELLGQWKNRSRRDDVALATCWKDWRKKKCNGNLKRWDIAINREYCMWEDNN